MDHFEKYFDRFNWTNLTFGKTKLWAKLTLGELKLDKINIGENSSFGQSEN